MKYLVGENLFALNSGTEFSQMQRLKAFKKAGIPAKIVLRNYNRILGQVLEDNGLDQDDVVNMYDFFQGTTNVPRKKQNLRLVKSIPLTDYHITGIDNNHSVIQDGGKTIANIHVMPRTVGLIGDIQYLDDLGHKAVGEFWDWRGFKSMVEEYHPEGTVATQRYLKQDGTTAIEVTHMYINHKVLPSMYKLYNYYGHNYVFDTENQFFTFFLNELNTEEPGTWISDRRSTDDSVLHIVDPKETMAVVHSTTFNDFKHPTAGILPAYQKALNQGDRHFDQVVFPTNDQIKDVAQVVSPHDNFVQAPDCDVEQVGAARVLGKNIKIIYRGMLGTNKKIGDLVKAFHDVRKQFPDAKLAIQGYFTDKKDEDAMKELIKQFHMEDDVKLLGYSPDDKIYDDATIYINASDNEAFGISMLESMGHGVPVVTYDIPYTAGNLVQDGVNGLLVKNKTPSQLAKAVEELIADHGMYQKLSQGALHTAQQFSPDHLVSGWQKIMKK